MNFLVASRDAREEVGNESRLSINTSSHSMFQAWVGTGGCVLAFREDRLHKRRQIPCNLSLGCKVIDKCAAVEPLPVEPILMRWLIDYLQDAVYGGMVDVPEAKRFEVKKTACAPNSPCTEKWTARTSIRTNTCSLPVEYTGTLDACLDRLLDNFTFTSTVPLQDKAKQ